MHLRSIQALRAVAALLVVAYHLSRGAFFAGQAGVDVFFVISGFIMGTVGIRETPAAFFLKRLVRIVPLYWLVTAFICTASVLGLTTRFVFDASTLTKSLLFIPYYHESGRIWPLVIPGWTLNLEMVFYAIFALGLLVAAPTSAAILVIGALVAAGAVWEPTSAPLVMWTMPIMLEFAAGLLLARLDVSGIGKGLGLTALGAAALAASAVLASPDDTSRAVIWGIPAVLLVLGAVSIERAGGWPPALLKPLEAVGDASYSLYLTHGLVLAPLHRKLGVHIVLDLAIALFCIGVALVSYRVFEKPVGRALSRWVGLRRPSPAPGPAAP